ncbi:MAG: EAL domain-containing protein [Betaproteobacteria bacterium]|nr:EAL domain-containing protein [Betaproteobacteria bacterium]
MASTILVADDNRANRDALAFLLETAGYRVLTAADGHEALALARSEKPELVVSDVLMPKMDGYELARRMRAEPAVRGASVIFYTAYFGQKDAKDLARAHGVARVLEKPADNDVILKTVAEVLASRSAFASHEESGGKADLDQGHLRVMVDQLLQKTGALEAQQRRVERLNRTLSTLSAVNALIVRAQDREGLLQEACRMAVETGGFGFAAVSLRDAPAAPLRVVAAAGEGASDPSAAKLPVEPAYVVCNDLEAQGGAAGREAALRRGLLSSAVLPLNDGGEAIGALVLYARQRDFFDEDELRLLRELAGDVSFALRHLAQKARMDYLAYHDALTGLPNRTLFADRLAQALAVARRERRLAAVIFFDVQRFRLMNETFGRKAGDELLRQVAARLRGAVHEDDTVARVAGDRFAIAAEGFQQIADVTRLIETIGEAFNPPMSFEGGELRVALRAGIALFPADGDGADLLSAHAETALSRAKDTGERHLFYAPEMNAQVAESLAMENRLRLAIEDGRLSLHYQPKVDIRTSKVAGLEALIRWEDPELGSIPPSRFVGLMEETGMILAAGRWALHTAVADIRRWQSHGLVVPRTAVNVSALQLKQNDFVDSVLEAIAGFEGGSLLDLEITESVLLHDIEDSTRKLERLRKAGVEVSVDDFGTGYSSLNYLARLPVDTLKIDRSFVMRMREAGYPRNIVAMIVSLAHTLGLKVIAEGVEEDEQMRLLRELGCDQIQGFLVSRPLPADKIEGLLQAANDGAPFSDAA